MATTRQGRTGLFSGQTLRRGHAPPLVEPTAALSTLGGVTYAWDRATDRLSWGPNATAVLELAPDALPMTGRGFNALVESLGGPVRDEASADAAYDLRYALRISPNSAILVQDSGRPFSGPDGTIVRGFLRSDPLSRGQDSLPRAVNDRTALLRRLHNDIAEALRFPHTVTLIVGEIVDGDLAEQDELARLIRPIMRRRDHLTLLPAGRFALVLTSCTPDNALMATSRLVEGLTTPTRQVRAAAILAPAHALDACRLLALVERDLDQMDGGSSALLHQARADVPVRATPKEPIDLVGLLNDRRLALVLEPIADAHADGSPLARARLAIDGGAVAPPILDRPVDPEVALLVDGRKLEQVASHLARWPDARIVMPIEIATLRDSEWLAMLAAHLGARPGIASRLIVALPEMVLIEKAKVLGRLDAMKALGIGLSLDGFGGGYATHARLRRLPIDLVCIDAVFTQTLARSTADRLFVRTLVDIAQHLGIATAGAGIDDAAVADMLRGWGIDYLEGSIAGPAVKAEPERALPPMAKRA
ncbi:EAL domain-containing protein [Microvirga antarctica]|uniref:EAL domain-containing protein n=1 Tax=Microvirga antarctica TaxID=2819233 RepID=UPI001B303B4E|nr:EAL domain-containing protein [Microvirga antarctica]